MEMISWLSQNGPTIIIDIIVMLAILPWWDRLYKKRLVKDLQALKHHFTNDAVEYIFGKPYVIVERDDYFSLVNKAEKLEEIEKHLVSRCQQTCAGRENYSGKLRHVPDCPAYDLGLVE